MGDLEVEMSNEIVMNSIKILIDPMSYYIVVLIYN